MLASRQSEFVCRSLPERLNAVKRVLWINDAGRLLDSPVDLLRLNLRRSYASSSSCGLVFK